MDAPTRKAVRIGIVVGIISSIIATVLYVHVLDPLLFEYLPSTVLRVAGAVSQGWTDTIFRDAAQPESTEGLSVLLMALLLVMLTALLLSGHRTPEQSNPTTTSQKIDPVRTTVLFCGILIAISLLLFALVRDTSSSIERCFRYRLTVLSPHLSEQETKELAASWTLMRSRADYDAIRGRLREYAEKYNVDPVIKSLEAAQQGQRRCI